MTSKLNGDCGEGRNHFEGETKASPARAGKLDTSSAVRSGKDASRTAERGPDPDPAKRTHADFCRPFHQEGPIVEAVREQLQQRATELGWRLTRALDIHLLVDGLRVEPMVSDLTVRFIIPIVPTDVWIISPTSRPSETMGTDDRRSLGIDIKSFRIEDGFTPSRKIATDDPLLTQGFSYPEEGHRWTQGRAFLPSSFWDCCKAPFFLCIELEGQPVARWIAPDG